MSKNYNITCDYGILRGLPRIGKPQALDCDWNILLLSNNKCFHKEHRCSSKAVKISRMTENPTSGMQFNCEPSDSKYMIFRSRVIYLQKGLSLRVLIQVMIHEVSHLVDKILENAGVVNVDTELRAYMNDYYCDSIMDMMSFASGLERVKIEKIKFREPNKKILIASSKGLDDE